jgi:hypothetical protein
VTRTIASNWKKRAFDRFNKSFSPQQVKTFTRLVDIASTFLGSESVFRRISQTKEHEAVFNYLAEIRFGLTFTSLEFELQFEPCGEKGPDLLVSRNGQSAYVEVRRIRPSRGQELHCGVLKQLAEPFVTWPRDLTGTRFSLENFAISGSALKRHR